MQVREVRPAKWVACIIIILILAVLFYKVAPDKRHYEPSKYFTKDGYYYAVSEEALEKMREYSRIKNNTALNTLIRDREIITLPDGMEVSIKSMASSMTGGYEVIQPKGETYELWSECDAITLK